MTTDAAPKLTLADFARAKAAHEPLTMVTAYDFHSARIASACGIDLLLVGDSAAQVVLGRDATTRVTLDEMLVLAGAVARGASRSFVIGDMPFMSYQPSDEQAVRSAGRFVAEAGVDAVKVEGAGPTVDRVRAIVDAGVPVIGHLGLTPQSATLLGGYRAQARSGDSALRLVHDAQLIERAGAFMVVLEAVPPEVAHSVASRVAVPVIGIGAGSGVDGQVLVWHDLLGLTPDPVPRFVRRFGDIESDVHTALRAYAADVRARTFPADDHTYSMPGEELERFHVGIAALGSSVGQA